MSDTERVSVLVMAIRSAIEATSVPAAEYVPAIPDAWGILENALVQCDLADFSNGPWTLAKRKAFMKLPMSERRRYMSEMQEKALASAAYLNKEEAPA